MYVSERSAPLQRKQHKLTSKYAFFFSVQMHLSHFPSEITDVNRIKRNGFSLFRAVRLVVKIVQSPTSSRTPYRAHVDLKSLVCRRVLAQRVNLNSARTLQSSIEQTNRFVCKDMYLSGRSDASFAFVFGHITRADVCVKYI